MTSTARSSVDRACGRAARSARAVRARHGRAGRAADARQARRRGARARRRHDRGLRRRDVRRVDGARPGAGAARLAASRCCCGSRPTPEPPISPASSSVHNPCLSGGTLEIFLEPVLPAPLLVVVGDAPIARALRRGSASALGYDGRTAVRRRDRRRTPRRSSSPRTAATRRRCSPPRCGPACRTSGWSPAASAARPCSPRSTCARRRRRGSTPRRARHRRPHAGGDRAVDPGRDRVASRPRPSGRADRRRRRRRVGGDRDRPGLRDDRRDRRGVAAPRPRRRGRYVVLRQRLPAGVRRRPGSAYARHDVTRRRRASLADRSTSLRGSASPPRLPRRPGPGDRAVLRRPAAAAAAARRRGRRRQDRGGQGARRRARHAAGAAAVLRGHRRRRGAVRVELPAPAARHPARRGARRRRSTRPTCSRPSTCVERPLLRGDRPSRAAAGGAADRRGRPRRRRVRGVPVRAARRVVGDDPGARHAARGASRRSSC